MSIKKELGKILVVGTIGAGRAFAEALAQADVIIVGTGENKETKEGIDESIITQQNPIPYKNFKIEPFESYKPTFKQENNPWPSPKGKRGKRRF